MLGSCIWMLKGFETIGFLPACSVSPLFGASDDLVCQLRRTKLLEIAFGLNSDYSELLA
jgi:hypothetical protein